ncbi:MAG: VWA domain-containing protein [Pseudomonadota bacterium]
MSERRLPVYLLLDTSGSMHGEPIQSVNVGLRSMLASLRQNPYALESVHLSITTFDSHVTEILPLTSLAAVMLPEVVCPESGGTFLGLGLDTICDRVAADVVRSSDDQKGDWRPLLFVMTDGKPSDTMAYEEAIVRVKAANFATVIACAAGPKSVPDQLKQLTDNVVSLDTMDSHAFSKFFQWVSATVTSGSGSVGASTTMELPPPPPEIQVVL